ncbi:MAG: pilin, partial [bacterium]
MFKNNLFFKRSLSLKATVSMVMVVLTLAVVFLVQIQPVLAQVDPGLNVVGDNIPLSNTDPRLMASRIIQIALSFLGIIAVGLILYAGFLWMTSGGNDDKVDKAKKILINAVIGLAIILAAWGIVTFIIGRLIDATSGGDGSGDGGGGGVGGGALGNGIIQSHYPE